MLEATKYVSCDKFIEILDKNINEIVYGVYGIFECFI